MTLKLVKNKTFSMRGKIESFYSSTVTKFGNGAKIDCRKNFIDRNVIIFVLKKGEVI